VRLPPGVHAKPPPAFNTKLERYVDVSGGGMRVLSKPPPSSSSGSSSSDTVIGGKHFQTGNAVHVQVATPCEVNVRVPAPRQLLRGANLSMAFFHAALTTLTLAVGNLDLTVPVYRSELFVTSNTSNPTEIYPVLVEDSLPLAFTWLTASFFAITCAAHLLNATLLERVYLGQLEQCKTPLRWIEYAISAPIMMVLIAYALGVRDRSLLFAIGTLVATTMSFGWWVEVVARPASLDEWCAPLWERLLPWAFGHVPQLAAWIIVILQLYDGVKCISCVPWFVFVILWVELVLFFSFGAATLVAQWQPPRRYYQGELLFQALSLVSKGLLGGLLIANVLMRSRYEDAY
jgi:hypothetical protein